MVVDLYRMVYKGVASYEAAEAFASTEILTMKNSKGYLEKGEN